jgi:hypothetical protein
MSTIKHLQAEITSRMRRGDAFATVEDEVINGSALSEPEKAALWLYGWSFVDWRRQRREAVAHIDVLVEERHAGTPTPVRAHLVRPATPTVADHAGRLAATVARRRGAI